MHHSAIAIKSNRWGWRSRAEGKYAPKPFAGDYALYCADRPFFERGVQFFVSYSQIDAAGRLRSYGNSSTQLRLAQQDCRQSGYSNCVSFRGSDNTGWVALAITSWPVARARTLRN